MAVKILDTWGEDRFVEEKDEDGNISRKWQYNVIHMCPCGAREAQACPTIANTTYSDIYECGRVQRYER